MIIGLIMFAIPILGFFIGIPLGIIGFFIFIYGLVTSDIKIHIQNINTGVHNSSKEEDRTSSTTSGFKFCHNCGAKIPKSAAFCPQCGEKQK
ncbi:MAG: zinc-ribbon domain-containing protein [Fervidicoccaceae archaeon]